MHAKYTPAPLHLEFQSSQSLPTRIHALRGHGLLSQALVMPGPAVLLRPLGPAICALIAAMMLLAGVSSALAQGPQTAQSQRETASITEASDLPPLIDRKTFFGDPEISRAKISPDGSMIAFRRPYNDVINVYVKAIDEPFDAAQPITADERPVPDFFWSRDSRYVLYVQDKGGNENYNVYAVDPGGDVDGTTGVPPARNLTPLEDVRAQILYMPEDRPNEMYVGLNDRNPELHDVYRIDIRTGERELIYQNEQNIVGWEFDLGGRLRLAHRMHPETGDSEIYRIVEGTDLDMIYTCDVLESCGTIRFHPDGSRVYLSTNRGDRDLTELVLLDIESGEETLVERDPEGESDFSGVIFSEKTDEVLATYFIGDRVRIYPRDDEFAADLAFLRERLPEGDIYPGTMTEDERKMLVSVTRDVDPGSVYLFDRDARTVELLYESRPELPTEHLAEMRAVRYTARDGLEIPAYLTLPKGVEPTNLPAVIFPHGGPWARDTYGYDAFAQYLANRGYVVLQPNFRGSSGYGKEFLNAGNRQWGTGSMQHDISDGVAWLIEQGYANPDRIAIMGGSYGGYATLAGLAFTPDLYAAGVDIVGPSNLFTLLASVPPYWAPIVKMFHERMGDPATPEGQAQLREQSPLFSAHRIEDPLLVIQGANDPRVKQHESDQIVVALRDRGFPVEYIVAPDEGHGFRGEQNQLAMAAAIERFLAQHIGGRYQEEMDDATAQRLAEITVDVSTVELPDPDDASSDAGNLPVPVRDLEVGSREYAATIHMQGQEMQMDVTRTVEETDRGWRVTETARGPMGEVQDTEILADETLIPLERHTRQGPLEIRLTYAEDRVEGAFTMNGQERPVDVALDAPVFSDGAGSALVVASLPLEEGYETRYRTFDLMSQQVRPMRLSVPDVEQVTVPAGTFEAFRVEVGPANGDSGGSTLWVSTDDHLVLRVETSVPEMGGALVTSELKSE